MPRATVNVDEVEKYPLKSLEGGEVTLRRMSYGAWLRRSEIAMLAKSSGASKEGDMEFQTMQKKVAQYEFGQCIVGHNLTDDNDSPLDFSKPHTLDILNPIIGNEIAKYIAELHEFEADLGNLQSGLTTS